MKKVEDQKCETFPVIKSCLAREALLLLSTLSIINAAADAFIHRRVNANTAPTHASTSCLPCFYSVTGEHARRGFVHRAVIVSRTGQRGLRAGPPGEPRVPAAAGPPLGGAAGTRRRPTALLSGPIWGIFLNCQVAVKLRQ